MGPVGAQDRSASEAESVEQVAGTAVTDPLRSDALAFLGSETQSPIGQEHLAHFLGRFRDLLIGVPLAEGHEALSILHFGGSHVQAGRIGRDLSQATVGGSAGSDCQPGHSPLPTAWPERTSSAGAVGQSGPMDWASAQLTDGTKENGG